MELGQQQQCVEEMHAYDSLNNMDLHQRTKPLKNDKIEYEAFQRKMIVSLVALSIAFCAVIATLAVIMYNLHDRDIKMETQLQNLNTSLKDIKETQTQWNETSWKMKEMFNQTLQFVNRQAEVDRKNQQDLISEKLKDLHQNVTLFQQELIEQQSKANQTMFEYIQQTGKNRVVVKMCAYGKTYAMNDIILFKTIHTMNGINDTGRSKIQTTGKFTCETPGIYVISVYIMTKTPSTYVTLYKNSNAIGHNWLSLSRNYVTNSVTVVEHLTVNDSIYVKARYDIFVFGDVQSCMSVIQVN